MEQLLPYLLPVVFLLSFFTTKGFATLLKRAGANEEFTTRDFVVFLRTSMFVAGITILCIPYPGENSPHALAPPSLGWSAMLGAIGYLAYAAGTCTLRPYYERYRAARMRTVRAIEARGRALLDTYARKIALRPNALALTRHGYELVLEAITGARRAHVLRALGRHGEAEALMQDVHETLETLESLASERRPETPEDLDALLSGKISPQGPLDPSPIPARQEQLA